MAKHTRGWTTPPPLTVFMVAAPWGTPAGTRTGLAAATVMLPGWRLAPGGAAAAEPPRPQREATHPGGCTGSARCCTYIPLGDDPTTDLPYPAHARRFSHEH